MYSSNVEPVKIMQELKDALAAQVEVAKHLYSERVAKFLLQRVLSIKLFKPDRWQGQEVFTNPILEELFGNKVALTANVNEDKELFKELGMIELTTSEEVSQYAAENHRQDVYQGIIGASRSFYLFSWRFCLIAAVCGSTRNPHAEKVRNYFGFNKRPMVMNFIRSCVAYVKEYSKPGADEKEVATLIAPNIVSIEPVQDTTIYEIYTDASVIAHSYERQCGRRGGFRTGLAAWNKTLGIALLEGVDLFLCTDDAEKQAIAMAVNRWNDREIKVWTDSLNAVTTIKKAAEPDVDRPNSNTYALVNVINNPRVVVNHRDREEPDMRVADALAKMARSPNYNGLWQIEIESQSHYPRLVKRLSEGRYPNSSGSESGIITLKKEIEKYEKQIAVRISDMEKQQKTLKAILEEISQQEGAIAQDKQRICALESAIAVLTQ